MSRPRYGGMSAAELAGAIDQSICGGQGQYHARIASGGLCRHFQAILDRREGIGQLKTCR